MSNLPTIDIEKRKKKKRNYVRGRHVDMGRFKENTFVINVKGGENLRVVSINTKGGEF